MLSVGSSPAAWAANMASSLAASASAHRKLTSSGMPARAARKHSEVESSPPDKSALSRPRVGLRAATATSSASRTALAPTPKGTRGGVVATTAAHSPSRPGRS